jgi:hypothetical protein
MSSIMKKTYHSNIELKLDPIYYTYFSIKFSTNQSPQTIFNTSFTTGGYYAYDRFSNN